MSYGINIYNSAGNEILSTEYPVMVSNGTYAPPVTGSVNHTFYQGSSYTSKTSLGSKLQKTWRGMNWSTSLNDVFNIWLNTGGNSVLASDYYIYGSPTNYKIYSPNSNFTPASGSVPTDYLGNLTEYTSSFDLFDPTPYTGGHVVWPLPVGLALNTSRWNWNAPTYADIGSTGYLSSNTYAQGVLVKPASDFSSGSGYGLECYNSSGETTYSSNADIAVFRGGYVDPTSGSNGYNYTWTIPSDVTHVAADRTVIVSDVVVTNFPQAIAYLSVMFIYRSNSTTLKSVWRDQQVFVPNVLGFNLPYFPDQRGNVQIFRIA